MSWRVSASSSEDHIILSNFDPRFRPTGLVDSYTREWEHPFIGYLGELCHACSTKIQLVQLSKRRRLCDVPLQAGYDGPPYVAFSSEIWQSGPETSGRIRSVVYQNSMGVLRPALLEEQRGPFLNDKIHLSCRVGEI